MRKTVLHDVHENKLKAKMAPFAGFNMPLQYTSAKLEIAAVRNQAGIFDVSHMGEFFVSGDETGDFINFMITNDYNKLPVGKAIYSPICNQEGNVLDDLIVYKLDENYALICVNAANIEQDWNWFSTHALNFNVSLENKSEDYSLIALQGPKSEELLIEVFNSYKEILKNLPYYGVHANMNDNIIFARTGYTGEDGFEVFCKNDTVEEIWESLLKAGATPCGLAARDTLRLEVCYPLYGHELDIKHTPRESSLSWTLKKSNSNYLGKESISIKSPDSKIVKLSLEKLIPREGYKIFLLDEEIGHVTSGTFSPTISQGIAMARVKNIKNMQEEDLLIEIRGKKYPAKLHKRPFYAGGIKK